MAHGAVQTGQPEKALRRGDGVGIRETRRRNHFRGVRQGPRGIEADHRVQAERRCLVLGVGLVESKGDRGLFDSVALGCVGPVQEGIPQPSGWEQTTHDFLA